MKYIFLDITLCSPLKANRRFGRTFRLKLQCMRISRERNQRESGWQSEEICYSETSVDFQQTTLPYIPEDITLYNHHCENLSS
jgi:hypothetical protein